MVTPHKEVQHRGLKTPSGISVSIISRSQEGATTKEENQLLRTPTQARKLHIK